MCDDSSLNDNLILQQNLKNYIRTNTDEFGGYSKPKWNLPVGEFVNEPEGQKYSEDNVISNFQKIDTREEDSLCKLVGIDID